MSKAPRNSTTPPRRFSTAARNWSRKALWRASSVDDAAVQFAQAKAQLDTAKEHLRTLQAAGKQAQIDQAKAQVAAAQGQLRSAETQVTYSEVRSPEAGVVADRPLYPGDIAQAGTPLMVVMDVSSVVARVNVPAADASGIKVGQDATINISDTGRGRCRRRSAS